MNKHFNLSAGIVLSACSVLTSCSVDSKEESAREISPVSVRTGTPNRRFNERINLSGQLRSRETATLSTRVMGFVSSVKVKPGDRVQKGQLLITINSDDMLAKRAQALAMISEAEAALKDAQKDYERFEELYKQQSATAKEFENATLRYNSVKAKAEAARQARNEVDAMLAYTSIVAPFSGVITQKNIDEGNMASPGMPLLAIEELNNYEISTFAAEREVATLKVGMIADVTVKSTGKKIAGTVSEVSLSSQLSGGQFQIKVAIPTDQSVGLYSGSYVNVSIPFKGSNVQGLFVPASAIIHNGQLSGLYTINDNSAHLRWLKVGETQGDEVEILSGIGPDETFIVQSDSKLYNGLSVVVNNR